MVYSGKSVQGLYNNTVHVQVIILGRCMVMWKVADYKTMMDIKSSEWEEERGKLNISHKEKNEDGGHSLLWCSTKLKSGTLREQLTLIQHWTKSSSILFKSLPAIKEVWQSSFFPIVQRCGQTMSSYSVYRTHCIDPNLLTPISHLLSLLSLKK